jgi:hypothetical protein
MGEYRRVTRQCASDDWTKAKTHEDVLAAHGGENIVKQFLSQNPATWYTQDALRDRTRDRPKGQPAPGSRPIGNVKVEGFRAWVWHDDGSVYDVDGAFPEYDIHWMIAYGNRRVDHRSDLQEKRVSLLHDPEDSWRPTDADYEDLLAAHDAAFTELAKQAIAQAAERAEAEHNTVVPITASELQGAVVHEHEEDLVQGVVVAEINERWLLLDKHRSGGRPLLYGDAEALSVAAFPEDAYPAVVSQPHSIRDGLLNADPDTHYIFYYEYPD